MFWQYLHNSIQDGQSGQNNFQSASQREDSPKTTQQQSNPNYKQRDNINGIKGIQRSSSLGDQGDCTAESHRSPTIEVCAIQQRVKADQSKKQKQTRRVSPKMERQRHSPQSKRKEESPERVLNEIEASKLSDIEFNNSYKEAQ